MANDPISELLKCETKETISDNDDRNKLTILPEHDISRMVSIKQMYDFFNYCNNKSFLNKRVCQNEFEINDIK